MEIPIVLKSRRFWSALVGGTVAVLIVLVPSLAQYANMLEPMILVIVSLLIGGFSLEDAMLARNDAAAVNTYKFGRK